MSAARLRECHPFRSAEARERYLAYYDAEAESWPVPGETRMVRTDHGETCVRVTGPHDAPPLVLQPGVWGHSLMWPPALIEALSEDFRTYAVDNICDVGRSVSSRPLTKTDEFMSWLDGLFDALGLADGINLMGCSRGAWLSAEYVLHAPHRLAKVVWLSPALVASGPRPGGFAGLPISLAALLAPSPATVGALMRWLMPDYLRSDPRSFDKYVADTALGLQCFDTTKACRYLGPRKFDDAELRGIGVPVLYMAGAEEKMSSATAAVSRLAAVAPDIETAVFPGAGHDLLTVQPEALGRRMLEFLASGPR